MSAHYEAYEFRFSATAANQAMPKAHAEYRARGHDYTLTIVLGAKRLNDGGYVVLPSRLGKLQHWIDTVVDGARLELLMDQPPTLASVAKFVYDEWWTNDAWGEKLLAVIVRTGDDRAAAYAPRGLGEEWLLPGAAPK